MEKNIYHTDVFANRHIGPNEVETKEMLDAIGVKNLEQLIAETIPQKIRSSKELNISEALSEYQLAGKLKKFAQKNKVYKSFIGLGYHQCITPAVILRNVFENPNWYTQYTPYQSEIAQGRLEALLNFQTVVCDLTGMGIANSSLLDEATATAEAMTMFYRQRDKKMKKNDADVFFVSHECFPQTIDVLKTRATPLGIKLEIGDFQNFVFHEKCFGALVQYPTTNGQIHDYKPFIEKAHENKSLVAVAVDLLSLAILTPPGEIGADAVVGNSQVFGVPMGYGGPHAAFFATHEKFQRSVPGRIVGISKDRFGNKAYRLALQTREQHIRREKATSNICTAQVLLAIIASMYAVYHGSEGLKRIANKVHTLTKILDTELKKLGYNLANSHYFNTLTIEVSQEQNAAIKSSALKCEMNFRHLPNQITIAIDETTTCEHIETICEIFATHNKLSAANIDFVNYQTTDVLGAFSRSSKFLDHPCFHEHRSETAMMRYTKSLENRDLSLTTSMIPLGSCTMKLNAAMEMIPVSWPEFSQLHPFAPQDQTLGYQELFEELEADLAEITGFYATSLQPNSGAQGEYAGLMVIRAYHIGQGQPQRNIALIPSSAHGTNPASAVMAGMKVVVVKCDEQGNIDVDDLQQKALKHQDNLSSLMITYPSTHGVFEEEIQKICQIIHENGGQVYMDGANMNAQVGLTSPGIIGADVCHLNLHKTFSIPHGGGGPGMGPICVQKHLAPYLPGHSLVSIGDNKAISAVSAAPWGSSSILLISYAYIKMMGKSGLKCASQYAILNTNYLKKRLERDFKLLYSGKNGRVAHEMIIDVREFKSITHVTVEDIAKRLMDYNYHAPTVSFPVPETMMIESTESENKKELDQFADALLSIRQEIREIEQKQADVEDNVLKNAPHTVWEVTASEWKHSYNREKACFPLDYIKNNKFWAYVSRINNVQGDRNLICTCPSIEEYEE
ncbi:aminomethyl-transferring glycine dehydrogenase [Candidatus Uabimicrobium sp. HlEnr_7]|uniref:aminomethyl-transferring glycine dehydrogenase n=1 Tax=Candidatus Uabimicrobium helgolandensis TaxID=3095367 RepID=UPI0035562835